METIVPQTMLDAASTRQFKAGMKNTDSLAPETASFANTDDSVIFIDVADGRVTLGLPRQDVRRINPLLSLDVLTALHDIYCLNCGNIDIPRSRDLAGAKDIVRMTIWGILRMNGEMT